MTETDNAVRDPGHVDPPPRRRLPEALFDLMHEPLDDLLVAADDVLFDWAKKATGDDARICFVLMRQLRLERAAVIQRFAARLSEPAPSTPEATASLAFDLDSLQLQDDEALEEDIAIGNMTARIADLVQASLTELRWRVEGAEGKPVALEGLDAIQPRALCRAFTDALHAVETTINLRLLLLKLFERAMLPQLPGIYLALNQQLAEQGFESTAPQAARPTAAARSAPTVADPPERLEDPSDSPWAQPSDAPALGDAQGAHPLFGDAGANPWAHAQGLFASSGSGSGLATGSGSGSGSGVGLGAATTAGAGTGWSPAAGEPSFGGGYAAPPQASARSDGAPPGLGIYASETRFAQEIGDLLSPQRLPQAPRSLAQRLDIVNRLFQGVRDDPMVRPELRPSLDALRYPLFKAALTDPTLVSNPQHPLRRLVDDATVLASARNLPLQELRPVLAELVDLAMSRLSPSAHQAREGLERRDALPDDALQGLEVQLRQSRQQRRRRLVDLAADGARLALVAALPPGRRLALEAEELVGRELVPLLALADLNFGRDSRAYQETRKVTTEWVEAYCNAPVPPDTIRNVVENLAEALVWARYPSERRERIAEATRALLGGQPEPLHHDEVLQALSGDASRDASGDASGDPSGEGAGRAASAPAAPAPSPVHGLVRAPHERISVGGYASVWDAAAGRARWLSLSTRDAHRKTLLFMDFCQEVRIVLSFTQFDADVNEGRSRLISG